MVVPFVGLGGVERTPASVEAVEGALRCGGRDEESASRWSPARRASARTACRSTRERLGAAAGPRPQEAVDHVESDPDAGNQAPRGSLSGSAMPHPACAASRGDGGDRVHEGGGDAEAVMVIDHLHGHLGDAVVVVHAAGDADRSAAHRGKPGHVAVTVDGGERARARGGQPDHPVR